MRELLVILLLIGPAFAQPALELKEVLQGVERHHPKLRGAQLVQRIASAKVLEKQGAFDPTLGMGSSYQRYNSSSSRGSEKDYFDNSIIFSQTETSGVKWEAGWIHNQGTVKSPASSTGQGGEFFVGAKVPLLRGLNINSKSVALRQAEYRELQAGQDYRLLRLFTLLDAGTAYYQWVTAVLAEKVVAENLELARERAEQVRQTIAAGDRPEIDQVEADREVEKRRELLRKAQRGSGKTALKLALYLWNSEGRPQPVPESVQAPANLPKSDPIDSAELARMQVEALDLRPELRDLDIRKKIVGLDRDLAANDRLPQLDLTLRPGYDSGNQGIGFNVKAGLQLVIPLGTRGPDGRERAASLKLEKLDLDQVEMVRRILLQIQDAAQEVEAVTDRLERALDVYRLARKLEEAERLKFEFGDSSLFLVNTRERSAVEAALEVLELRNELAQAQLLLEAVRGSL